MTNLEASYLILGVSRAATPREIKEAYRNLVRRYHPDLNPKNAEAEERLKQLNIAYEALCEYHNRRSEAIRKRNMQIDHKEVSRDHDVSYNRLIDTRR